MIEGDIVKAYVRNSDGTFKARPVVLLKKLPYFDDWLICGISSKIQTVHTSLDILIQASHPDFPKMGLHSEAIIRGGWLSNFPESKIEGTLGALNKHIFRQLRSNISIYISI